MGIKDIQVFLSSFLALGFVVLALAIDWLFLIPAVIIMIINQKRLMKKDTKKQNKEKKNKKE